MTADIIAVAVSDVTSAQSLHEKLAATLGFPGYYGKNWDAFWDCITDPDQSAMPRRLLIKGFDVLQERLPREADLLRQCLLDRQREHPEFEVVFEKVEGRATELANKPFERTGSAGRSTPSR